MEQLISKKSIQHLSKDEKLKSLIDQITLPKRNPAGDVYAGLIQSIVSQQLSVKAASTIYGRFINLFSEGYPKAEQLINFEDSSLRGVGLSGQKTGYVKNVATFFLEHKLFLIDWANKSDEEIISLLTQIKGVGKWTVQMILMFVLYREDVFPTMDLGIQQGIQKLYGVKEEKKKLLTKMELIAEPWRPYRTVACLYLWESKQLK